MYWFESKPLWRCSGISHFSTWNKRPATHVKVVKFIWCYYEIARKNIQVFNSFTIWRNQHHHVPVMSSVKSRYVLKLPSIPTATVVNIEFYSIMNQMLTFVPWQVTAGKYQCNRELSKLLLWLYKVHDYLKSCKMLKYEAIFYISIKWQLFYYVAPVKISTSFLLQTSYNKMIRKAVLKG